MQWRPDTCGCVLEVSPDWLSGKALYVCPDHTGKGDTFALVLNENTWKNSVVNFVSEQYPNADVAWSWNVDGTLAVTVPGADATKLQSDINVQFGASDVKVA